jgi:hypothetical protein
MYGNELATFKLRPVPELLTFDNKYLLGSVMKALPHYLLPGVPRPKKPGE